MAGEKGWEGGTAFGRTGFLRLLYTFSPFSFSVLFVSGAVVTLLDAAAWRRPGIREALARATPLPALGRTLGWLVAVPWLAFAAAWLPAFAPPRQETIIGIFTGWMVLGVLYDLALIRCCKAGVRGGLRQRPALASS